MENASEGGQQAVDYVSKNWLRLLNAGGMGMWVKGEALGVDRSELGLLTPWITVAPMPWIQFPFSDGFTFCGFSYLWSTEVQK